MSTEQDTKIDFPDYVIQKVMKIVADISNIPEVPVLILIRGLPGSGKSTFAKFLEVTFKTLKRKSFTFEADQYFVDKQGNYIFDRTKLHKAHYWCRKNTYQNLQDGNIVVVSNTFTTRKEINEYVELAKDKHVPMVVFALKNSFGNIHNVPDESIERMKARWVDLEKEIVIDFSEVPDAS